VALLEAFRAAMKELGVQGKIVAADITATSAGFQRADVGEIVPPVGRLEYLEKLVDIVETHDIGLLVPLTDLDLRRLARQKDRFAERGCEVMIGSEQVVSYCRDKKRLNRLLRKADLATIKTLSPAQFVKEPFFPCFVKPARGSAGIGSGVVQNEQQFQAHLTTFGEAMVVQEFVPGQEFTIDVYRDRQGQVRCVVPRQRLVVRSGEVEKGVTRKDPELIDAAIRLAGTLGDLWGVFCCQCRRSREERPRFFEVNPRFGGGVPLSVAAGANLPRCLLEEVLHRPVTARVGEFTDNLVMMRYDEAVFTQVENLSSLPGYKSPQFR